MEYVPKYIIVHHSAANAPSPQFSVINRSHEGRGFPISKLGFHVGYHRVIEKDGSVQIARGDLERDCDAFGKNFDSLSVCLVGNFNTEDPTPEQIAALGPLLAIWCKKYNLSVFNIHAHRFFGKTACYGSRLRDNWASIVCLKEEIIQLEIDLANLQRLP